MRKSKNWKMKVVGDRVPAVSLADFDVLQKTVEALSKKPVGPRGVFRFRTFEEANAWKMKMLARAASRR
ncbi:MAG: hypothetical protein HY283_06910 [Nitrospirae bacterium]|nr:hypothetical protein [Nitrospirota bacterium]